VTEEHFAKAVQNEVQQPAVVPRTGSQVTLPAHKKTPVLQGFAAGCEVVQSGEVEDRGLEPVAFPCGNRVVPGQGGAKSGANETGLASVIRDWHSLPPDTRTAILAIVAAAQGR